MFKNKITQEELLVTQKITYKIIPSIGTFPNKQYYNLIFKNTTLDDIEASLFVDLIEGAGDNITRIIADFSTGLNIYTIALNNVMKDLIIYHKIMMLDKELYENDNKKQRKQYAILQTPPIRDEDERYPFYYQEVDAKFFMEYPFDKKKIEDLNFIDIYNKKNLTNTEKKKLGEQNSEVTKMLKNILFIGLYLNNTIKYNAPLAGLYYKNILSKKNIDIDNLYKNVGHIKKIISHKVLEAIKPNVKITGNNILVYRKGINKKFLRNIIYGIETALSLSRLYDALNEENKKEECYPLYSIDFLKRMFKDGIYRAPFLGPNRYLLAKDLSDYEKGKITNSKKDPDERTFFAHSGMPEGYIKRKMCIGYNDHALLQNYEKIYRFLISTGI